MRRATLTAILVLCATPAFAAGAPTFSKDVAPILFKSCVACHRPTAMAPMSLMTCEDARPWARAIRQKVATRQMPPWGADPTGAKYSNDVSLKQAEIDTITAWVDGGSLEGDRRDLPKPPTFAEGWSISGPGPVVAGGMLYVNSGYGALGGRPGNVRLAFGIDATADRDIGRIRSDAPNVRVAPPAMHDLEGVWSYATLTPFERPADLAGVEFFTDAQAAAFEAQTLGRNDRDRRDGGAAVDAARGVADYWFDRGEHVASIDGRKRTSWVIDPPDGRVPALTPDARAKMAARNADAREHQADGPESRSLQERCLAFNAGPPIGLGPYNNFLQIVQSRDAVVLYTEMIHDARIVWTDGRPHADPLFRQWLGDSRGTWEGNTLVVDTTNFTDKNPFRGAGETLHLTERFTRTAADTLVYEFAVDDPATFTRPWTAQLPMTRSGERIFEYACHEGNYALPDILRGARYQERQGQEK